MSDLDEILGALLKGLANARVTADRATRDAYELYRSDPLMAEFPVPRLVVRDAELTLRFVVNQEEEGAFEEALELAQSRQWGRLIGSALARIAVDAAADAALRKRAARQIAKASAESLASGSVRLGVREGLASAAGRKKVVASSVAYAKALLATVDAELAPALLKGRALDQALKARLPTLFDGSRTEIERAGTTEAALSRRFDVSITGDALAAAPEASVHAITIRLGGDDARVVAPRPEGDGE